jgi:hypothetical protein
MGVYWCLAELLLLLQVYCLFPDENGCVNGWMNEWKNYFFEFPEICCPRWNDIDGKTEGLGRKPYPSATLSTTNPIELTRAWTQAAMVTVTNSLNHGTALFVY